MKSNKPRECEHYLGAAKCEFQDEATLNPEDYVSYPIALALKKAGFDYPCYFYYTRKDAPDDHVWSTTSEEAPIDYNRSVYAGCSMPTLAQTQKWLRDRKGIYAYCEPNRLEKWFARAIDLAKNEDLIFDGQMFDNFEEATEHAIAAALELIDRNKCNPSPDSTHSC